MLELVIERQILDRRLKEAKENGKRFLVAVLSSYKLYEGRETAESFESTKSFHMWCLKIICQRSIV